MNHYELLYLTDPSNEDGVEDVKKRIEGIITGREGSVVTYEKLGKKRLAYPIQKRQYGVYYLVNLQGDGRIVQALDYFLRLNSLVLRHIVLNLSEKQLKLKELTEKIQKEETERMRRGGRPHEQLDIAEKKESAETSAEKPDKVTETPVETTDESSKVEEPAEVSDETSADVVEEDIAKQQESDEKPERPETETVAEELESSNVKTEETKSASEKIDDENEKTVE